MAPITILLLGIFTLATTNICFTNASSNTRCIEIEKQALLIFKQNLLDPANRLASWVQDEDCCSWVGVVCGNASGHVLELHLGNPGDDDYSTMLGGNISHSLLNLKHLSYLDLGNNDFGRIRIPDFFGSMGSLIYLNLSDAGFGGLIPHQLGNLSNMQYLILQGGYKELYVENLRWLAGISGLKYLDISSVDLSKASDWLQTVNKLTSLKQLHASSCKLPPPSVVLNSNFSSLAVLDLMANGLQHKSPIISWVISLNKLVFLDLTENDFEGPIPDGLRNLTSLRHLDLAINLFNSSIPDWFYDFSPLQFLGLSHNILEGKISSAVGNMTSAISLDLSSNHELEGGIPKSIGNLCNLRSIYLSEVNLSQSFSEILEILSGCISHGLESLDLSGTRLFGQLTDHLRHFKTLTKLYLDQNSISGSIPQFLGELSMLKVLVLSNNKLKGNLPELLGQLEALETLEIANNMLDGVVYEAHFANLTKLKSFYANGNSLILKVHPNWIPPFQLQYLELGSWHLGPQFPPWLHSQTELLELDISSSRISDSIPSWFWNISSQFYLLNISHNQIYGGIPYIPVLSSFASFDFSSNAFGGLLPQISSNLGGLDLSKNSLSGSLSSSLCQRMNETMLLQALLLGENHLSGEIPDCWMKWPNLQFIRLDGNNFTGSLPNSLGTLEFLGSLYLRNNRIRGVIPPSLQNCTNLMALDFSGNKLNGHVPTWLGLSVPNLMILSLRTNQFHGHIPHQLCSLRHLQVLDLSHNNLSGYIPKCIDLFSAMARPDGLIINNSLMFSSAGVLDNVFLVMKGAVLEYSKTLGLVKSIDFSSNGLSGEIPPGLTRLMGLQSLNLSLNHLDGRIPDSIGAMRSLESLDFSKNQLFGSLPESISQLTFLSHLNLSYNNLVGRIPSSTQLLGFDASSFIGNRLCGPPLTPNCNVNGPNRKNAGQRDSNGVQVDWFYVSMAIGYTTGFGAVLVPLMLSRRWRYIFFQFLDQMWTRLICCMQKLEGFIHLG